MQFMKKRCTDVDRRLWTLAVPNIVSNLSTPLLGLVDTAIIGHLPSGKYLAAVAMGTAIFNLIYFVFMFLRMGTTGLAAQAKGKVATRAFPSCQHSAYIRGRRERREGDRRHRGARGARRCRMRHAPALGAGRDLPSCIRAQLRRHLLLHAARRERRGEAGGGGVLPRPRLGGTGRTRQLRCQWLAARDAAQHGGHAAPGS